LISCGIQSVTTLVQQTHTEDSQTTSMKKLEISPDHQDGELSVVFHTVTWLLILKTDFKPRIGTDICCAEVPNASEEPELFEAVKKFMAHRRCGVLDSTSPCMKDDGSKRIFRKRCAVQLMWNLTDFLIFADEGNRPFVLTATAMGTNGSFLTIRIFF
uniref:THUMP domain-containing protein n=1 Tax=Heligmosomoides polygyrus TaxID=6339 RepID=A0A183GNL6_HELPZ